MFLGSFPQVTKSSQILPNNTHVAYFFNIINKISFLNYEVSFSLFSFFFISAKFFEIKHGDFL